MESVQYLFWRLNVKNHVIPKSYISILFDNYTNTSE